MSDAFGGIGSLAISAVPVLENTKATCGKRLTVFSTASCIACDCVSAVLGMRQRVHRDVLFVERRDELLAEPGEAEAGRQRTARPPPAMTGNGAAIA